MKQVALAPAQALALEKSGQHRAGFEYRDDYRHGCRLRTDQALQRGRLVDAAKARAISQPPATSAAAITRLVAGIARALLTTISRA